MQCQSSSWSDLKSEYYYNLKTLQTAITAAHTSMIGMTRIYSEVIKKSKDTSTETLQKFVELWFDKTDNDDLKISEIQEEYKKLMNNPTEKTFQDMGLKLQDILSQKSIRELEACQKIMANFYKTWKEMWPN